MTDDEQVLDVVTDSYLAQRRVVGELGGRGLRGGPVSPMLWRLCAHWEPRPPARTITLEQWRRAQ